MQSRYEAALGELAARFGALLVPSGDAQYAVDRLQEPAFLAKDAHGAPAIVFRLKSMPLSTTSLISTGLEFAAHQTCRLHLNGKATDASIAVLTCRNEKWRNEFVVLAADVARAAAANPAPLATFEGAREFFKKWSALFCEEKALTVEQKLGLWGELHVLNMLTPLELAVDAWHGPEAHTFDFGNNGVSVEVKTSTVEGRHVFGLEQLEAGKSALVIASIHVRLDHASGTTVADEASRLLARTKAPIALEEKLFEVGVRRLDADADRISLVSCRFFDGDTIPRPRAIDDGVDQVSFRVDLAHLPPIAQRQRDRMLSRLTALSPTKSNARKRRSGGRDVDR